LLSVAEKATPGPYFTAADDAHDAPDHENSGLAMVETGRSEDWWIARLIEWPTANFIAAFDPTTCAELVREVIRLTRECNEALDQCAELHRRLTEARRLL
jgi:hypothetical protein